MSEELSIVDVEVVEGEWLSLEESLFFRGGEIYGNFKEGLQGVLWEFLTTALPFANEVWLVKAWKAEPYKASNTGDDERDFRRFLKDSFQRTDRSDQSAYKYANIVSTAVLNEWELEKFQGVSLKAADSIAANSRHLPPAEIEKLFDSAKEKPYNELMAEIQTVKGGYHVEPTKYKTLSASVSAIELLNQFCDAAKEAGDTRPEGEILADVAGTAFLDDPEFGKRWRARRLIALWHREWAKLFPQNRDFDALQIQEATYLMHLEIHYAELSVECQEELRLMGIVREDESEDV